MFHLWVQYLPSPLISKSRQTGTRCAALINPHIPEVALGGQVPGSAYNGYINFHGVYESFYCCFAPSNSLAKLESQCRLRACLLERERDSERVNERERKRGREGRSVQVAESLAVHRRNHILLCRDIDVICMYSTESPPGRHVRQTCRSRMISLSDATMFACLRQARRHR